MWKKRWLVGGAVALVSLVLTSAILYWVPVLSSLFGARGSSYDYSYDFYPDVIDYSYSAVADALKASMAEGERASLDAVSEGLANKSTSALTKMKVYGENLCINGSVDCLGLPASTVRALVDAILEDRQLATSVMTMHASRTANTISIVSAVVSIFALLISLKGRVHLRSRSDTTAPS